MVYEFETVLERYSKYMTTHLIVRLVRIVSVSSLCLSAMLLLLSLGLAPIGGLFLLGVLLMIATDLVRLVFWIYHIGLKFWTKFRPPYRDKDLVFSVPNHPIDYRHDPDYSAVRLPFGILLISMVMWMVVQRGIETNLPLIIGFTEWVIALFPSDSLQVSYSLISFLTGIPGWEELPSRSNIVKMSRILLWVPSLYISTLFMWNVLYTIDFEFAGDYVENDLHPKFSEMNSPPLAQELANLVAYLNAIAKGVIEGYDDTQGILIRGVVLPLILLIIIAKLVSLVGL